MPRSFTNTETTPPVVPRIPGLATHASLVHGMSTLALGDMRAPAPGDAALTPARGGFAEALGLEPDRLVVAGAVHDARVARVDEPVGVLRGVRALGAARPRVALRGARS